jgi:sugar phosphate isomerase/epimerase
LAVNKENISDIVEMVDGYDTHYHIDDNRADADEHLIPGDGGISYEPFLSRLKKSGYQGYLTVELGFGYTNDPDAACLKSLNRMKELLK